MPTLTVWAYNADNVTVNGERRAEFSFSQTKGNSSQNYSTINWTLAIKGSSSYYDTGPIEAWIGGKRVYHLADRKSWSYGQFPVKQGSVDGSFTLNHNNDGSIGSQWCELKAAIFTGTVHTSGTTWNLEGIARYFSSTPSLTLKSNTETSLTYNWSTSETCSEISISGSGTKSVTGVPGKSGTITITGLSANTSYTHTGTFKRSDSGLTSTASSTKSTEKYPYIKSVGSTVLTIGSKQTFSIHNPLGRSVTIQMYTADGKTLLGTSSATTGTAPELTPTALNLYKSIPNAQSANCIYKAVCASPSHTESTNSTTYSYKIIGNEAPTFAASQVLTYDGTGTSVTNITSQTAADGWLVQSISKLKVVINTAATVKIANDTATISSYKVTFNNIQKTLTVGSSGAGLWDPINASGTQTVSITVTDSRGLTTTVTKSVTYKQYSAPSISLTANRQNNYGETVNLSAYYTSSSVESKNTITVTWQGVRNSTGAVAKSGTMVAAGGAAGNATKTASTTGILNDEAYTFSATITDKFGKSATSSVPVSIGVPIMFVDSAVLGLGVNKFPTVAGLDVNGPIKGSSSITAAKGYFTDTYKTIDGGNTNNYPWHRIATVTAGTGSWTDKDAIIEIRHRYNGGGYGRAKVGLRTNNATNGDAAHSSVIWLERKGIPENSLAIAHWGVSGNNVYADVYYKVPGTYPRASIHQIDETMLYTLVTSLEKDNTTTSDKKGSTEVYKDIATAATELRGQAYAAINYAVDNNTFLLDTVYPKGSIYMSTENVSPASFLGGTWNPINNVFLLAQGSSYSAGGTGGEATVGLAEANLPGHTHKIPVLSGSASSVGDHSHTVTDRTTSFGSGSQSSWRCLAWSGTKHDFWDTVSSWGAGGHSHTISTNESKTGSTGSGTKHNNMPPYLVVYMWKRTA